MTDEKPKHKPQKKHTLNEVLKSLQDLIRNDLGGTRAAAKTARQAQKRPGETTSFAAATRLTGTGATPSTGSEADSFNQALEKLDEIIHEKIIEPVERIRQAPPEPLTPEDDLQIDWEDTTEPQAPDPREVQFDLGDNAKPDDIHFEAAEPASSGTATRGDDEIEFEAFAPAAEESAEPAPENIDIDALGPAEAGAIEDIELTPLDFVENPSEEPIEPARKSRERAADDQSAFSFNESAFESEPALPDRDSLAAQAEAEPPAPALESMKTEPTLSFDTALRPQEPRRWQGPEADKGPATFTVEYRSEPKPAATDATAETKRESQPAAAAPPGDVQKHAPPPEPVEPAASSRTVPEYEIPVLKDVAELDVSRSVSPPLPAAGQAREIAIRVIARLNIERRKAGEPPLDIKTIEQLQQYLAEALTKRALNKPT